MKETELKIANCQIATVWLNKQQTTFKIISQIDEAGIKGCELIVFGEGLLPGYPFWVKLTDGARFNSDVQMPVKFIMVSELFAI